jgi:hypothetical protein
MAAIRRNLAEQVAAIRADTRYTAKARTQELAKVTVHARAEAKRLLDDHKTAIEDRRKSLHSSLFGPGVAATNDDILLFRDARERAQQINDPAKALKELEQARLYGDESLARAIAAHAFDKPGADWSNVVTQFADGSSTPGQMTVRVIWLQQLADLPEDSTTSRLADAATFKVSAPSELQDFLGGENVDSVLRNIAEGAERTWVPNSDNEMVWVNVGG